MSGKIAPHRWIALLIYLLGGSVAAAAVTLCFVAALTPRFERQDFHSAVATHGPDGSGATGRAGALQWEVYAEDPGLGRVPVQVWVHGPGWSVTCSIRPPGAVPTSGCVTVKEPARLEGARR